MPARVDGRVRGGRTCPRCAHWMSGAAAALLALLLLAPAASAVETETKERPNVVVTFNCFTVTAQYRGFPDAPNNTVTAHVTIGTTHGPFFNFTFNGPSGTDVIPINPPKGRDRIDLDGHWKTNGFTGRFDLYAGLTCRTYMTGRAYGLSAEALLLSVPPIPDTGPVVTPEPSNTSTPCLNVATGAINAEALCGSVTTTLGPPQSTGKVTIAQLRILGLAPVPGIEATVLEADSTSTCTGAAGLTKFASLTIGTNTFLNYEPAPNTTITLPGEVGQIVLNEQLPVPGADQGLTVNAIHVTVPTAGINVVVASATSDIHRC